MTELRLVEHDDAPRCAICGAEAAGPCMRCHAMVCGDCCVLTEGGVGTYAICVRCDRRGGRDVGSMWTPFLRWMAALAAAIAALTLAALLLLR